MPTIADLIGLNRDQPRWRTTTAWELRPGDLVRVAADDVRLVARVWANQTTGAVTVEWASGRFSDLDRDTTMKVKTPDRKATP